MMPFEERTSVLCKASALRTACDVNQPILATHQCVINAVRMVVIPALEITGIVTYEDICRRWVRPLACLWGLHVP